MLGESERGLIGGVDSISRDFFGTEMTHSTGTQCLVFHDKYVSAVGGG